MEAVYGCFRMGQFHRPATMVMAATLFRMGQFLRPVTMVMAVTLFRMGQFLRLVMTATAATCGWFRFPLKLKAYSGFSVFGCEVGVWT